MTNAAIRTILGASSFESFVRIDTIKEKIASGEITDVHFGCGDNVNAVYATFDTYEEALEAHEKDVAEATKSAVEVYTSVIDEARSDYEEHGYLASNYDYDWIEDAIEEDWGAKVIDAKAKKDAKNFNWICLINADNEADREDDQVCMIY